MTGEGTAGTARLVVADAHPVVRRAVRMSCDALPGLEVVGEADTGSAVLAVCEELRPDVAVLDIAMPGGSEAIRGLHDRRLVNIVVVLTDRTDGASVMEALRLGVEGYLVKSSALHTVGRQIQRVLDGERVISPEVQRTAVGELGAFARMAREGSEVRASLTPREHEVLMLISQGLTMRQMANRLGISPRTVETHMSKLYRKLDVRTRVQAMSRAVSLGLIELR
ncbi:MAG: LuxR C-terminal-related transcriptional regulator [Actinomycetota bacterium]